MILSCFFFLTSFPLAFPQPNLFFFWQRIWKTRNSFSPQIPFLKKQFFSLSIRKSEDSNRWVVEPRGACHGIGRVMRLHVGIVKAKLQAILNFPAGSFVLRSRVVIVINCLMNLPTLEESQWSADFCVHASRKEGMSVHSSVCFPFFGSEKKRWKMV